MWSVAVGLQRQQRQHGLWADVSWSGPSTTTTPTTNRVCTMLYYSVEPQLGALLFSVCGSRHERFTGVFPDLLACPVHGPPQPLDIALTYAQAIGLQIYTIGEHYACLFQQVRAGSVIFLVGVGSLVCWKLWEHWRSGPPPPTEPITKPKCVLLPQHAEDLDYLDEEDAAFIEGDLEELSYASSFVSEEGNSALHHYLADASASYSHDDLASSHSENSLPTDGDSDVELIGRNKVVKRKHKASELQRKKLLQTGPSSTHLLPPNIYASPKHGYNKTKNQHLSSSSPLKSGVPHASHLLVDSCESSPDHVIHHASPSIRKIIRHQGDGSETPDSEEQYENHKRTHQIPLSDSNSKALSSHSKNSKRLQPEGSEEGSNDYMYNAAMHSDSLDDLIQRMRTRGHKTPISRDNSIVSNISDLITSPHSNSRRFTFTRSDSTCSNLSDFAPSECCSEMSLDVSIHDDLAYQTFTYLDDIEHELDDLKTSIGEMDQEVCRFAQQPNPYSFKTTFSDGATSGESRPNSALEIITAHRNRSTAKNFTPTKTGILQDGDMPETGSEVSGPEIGGSFEWDSPQHGWSSFHNQQLYQLPETSSEEMKSPGIPTKDESVPSLEWDNNICMEQSTDATVPKIENTDDLQVFQHNATESSIEVLEGFEEYKHQSRWQQLLPDHSSLELDMEEELLANNNLENEAFSLQYGPTAMTASALSGCPMNASVTSAMTASMASAMTASVDSAFHSQAGSRSNSSSPVPAQAMSRSSDGFGRSQTSFSSKENKSLWSSQESGYLDGDNSVFESVESSQLSPVHEIRDNEISENIISRFQQSLDSLNDNESNSTYVANENNVSDNCLNNNVMMGNSIGKREHQKTSEFETNNSTASSTPAIGERVKLLKYAEEEWKGTTDTADTMKQGYSAIPTELNLHYMRRIRGDNYCAVRASIYQVLSQGLPIPKAQETLVRLNHEINSGSLYLKDWTFGHRLNFNGNATQGFKVCLDALDQIASSLSGCENREYILTSRLNSDPTLDMKLCEAVKLHMFAEALRLHSASSIGNDVPVFAMIMFARHTSVSPQDLLHNHLNQVGDSGGLEQIEMFLLGHTLGVTLQVIRPGSYRKEDFICYYPDDNIGVWPQVALLAEDDRHYNIVVK